MEIFKKSGFVITDAGMPMICDLCQRRIDGGEKLLRVFYRKIRGTPIATNIQVRVYCFSHHKDIPLVTDYRTRREWLARREKAKNLKRADNSTKPDSVA